MFGDKPGGDRRSGLISRFFSRSVPTPPPRSSEISDAWADNASQPVRALLSRVLREPECLIVTGYQDFLSTLTILLETLPDLDTRPKGSIRIVFGTNTDNRHEVGGKGRAVAEEARQHFLGARGLGIDDLADLRAVLAMEAIERGVIELRIFDGSKAFVILGRRVEMLHAKLFVGTRTVLSGSANLSVAGLHRNLEFTDDAGGIPTLAAARRESAEAFWRMGVDWTDTALEILRGLIRWTTPEEALARAVLVTTGFKRWKVSGTNSTGRSAQPFQAELVYEAAGTVHEHGFAFVEAPTGAGKTDIGKHLATLLPVLHRDSVLSLAEEADRDRSGALALVPAAVVGNWESRKPSSLSLVRHSHLSSGKDAMAELADLDHKVKTAAAMIVDESHRLSSRYLAQSKRSQVFERCPAIWTACLSATLMGNQGLDGLLAFHEKRASIYVPPRITSQINDYLGRVRKAAQLREARIKLAARRESLDRQADLFLTNDELDNEDDAIAAELRQLGKLQEELAALLAPYVARRQRDCIGESADRTRFCYPLIESHRRDAKLTPEQAELLDRIKYLANSITSGRTMISAENSRTASPKINVHDISRIHIRNFLAVLRASIAFAGEVLSEVRGEGLDARGKRSLGEALRDAEKRGGPKPDLSGAIAGEYAHPDSKTPICDRIASLLSQHALTSLDHDRALEMKRIVRDHGQAIFLAERVGVLQGYARRIAAMDPEIEVYLLAQNQTAKPGNVHALRNGAEAQELFALDGKHASTSKKRAVFMTFQMAEGINLQRASALGIIGVTSDLKSLIQGLGRIDRIDSPHAKISYYTFDLPGLVLTSDRKARERVKALALLSGLGADETTEEIKDYAAGDLTDFVLDQIRKPRPLRADNHFDQIERSRRMLSPDVLIRVSGAAPVGPWGAELCRMAATEAVTILVLAGQSSHAQGSLPQPPRLVALRGAGDRVEIIGDQAEAAKLLADAYKETKDRGLHLVRPTLDQRRKSLDAIMSDLSQLTAWDIRPARTVSLLATLAGFLTSSKVEDQGRALFGDLDLPALEKLAEEWASELDPSWIEAKQNVAMGSKSGAVPDYLGIEEVFSAFKARTSEDLAAANDRMAAIVEACRTQSERDQLRIVDRVAVIFDAHPA